MTDTREALAKHFAALKPHAPGYGVMLGVVSVETRDLIVSALRASSPSAEREAMPVAKPVAFRVPRAEAKTAGQSLSNDDFQFFANEELARREANLKGTDYDGLYLVADRRAAFFAQPCPSDTSSVAVTEREGDYSDLFALLEAVALRMEKEGYGDDAKNLRAAYAQATGGVFLEWFVQLARAAHSDSSPLHVIKGRNPRTVAERATEPVAWRWKSGRLNATWKYTLTQPFGKPAEIIEPLYASPAAPSPAVEREALLDALDRVIGHDPNAPSLSYPTVKLLLESAAGAARDLRAALAQPATAGEKT